MTTDPPDREPPADAGTTSAGEAKAAPLDDVVASLIDEKPARPRLSVVPPPAEGASADDDGTDDSAVVDEPEAPLPPGAVKVDLGKLLDLGGLSGGLRELAGWIEKQVPQLNAAVSKFLSSVEVVLTSNDAFPVPGVSEADRAEATKGAQSPLSVVADEPGPDAPGPGAPVEEPGPNPQPTPDPNPGPDPAPVRDPDPVPDPNPGNDPLPIHDPPPPLEDDPGRDPLPIGDPVGDPAPMGDPINEPDPIATD